MMQKVFPIVFGLITYRFPAGVALYWLAQSLVRIVQQWAMYRFDPSLTAEVKRDILEIEERTADLDKGSSKTRSGLVAQPPKKGFFARMMEAAATQQEAKGKAAGTKPSTKPSASKPSTSKPSTSKPSTSKPSTGKPAASKPPSGKSNGAPTGSPDVPAAEAGNGSDPTGAGGKAGTGNGADPPIRPNRPAPSNRSASRKRARRGR
jgi:hypothetical protein